jgi:predicted glutamine amidotransferase
MCGLAGFNGAKAPNINKLQILGMLNVQRGKHSCGIMINNKIGIGINKESEFQNLIEKYQLPTDFTESNNIIIHTRHATMGTHSIDNAHPFGFSDNPLSKKYSFIGAHNGKLSNHVELLKKYNINSSSFNVDSEALLFILFNEKNFKVLSEYKGAAALLFTFTDEPNTMYAFRGAAGGVHERPLYYTKHEEGVYFSSLASSLKIIGNHNYEVFEFLENRVYKFKDGKIVNNFPIARNASLNPETNFPVQSQIGFQTPAKIEEPKATTTQATTNSFHDKNQLYKIFEEHEVNPYQTINKCFSWRYFRYFRNGHIFTGVAKAEELDILMDKNEDIYFGNGVILKDKKAYEEFVEKKENLSSVFVQSKYWKYPMPIVVFDNNYSVTSENRVLFDGILNLTYSKEETIEILGLNIEYSYQFGKLTNISEVSVFQKSTGEKDNNESVDDIHEDIFFIDEAIVDLDEKTTSFIDEITVKIEKADDPFVKEELIRFVSVLEGFKAELENYSSEFYAK